LPYHNDFDIGLLQPYWSGDSMEYNLLPANKAQKTKRKDKYIDTFCSC
jgi:hypothetical protein